MTRIGQTFSRYKILSSLGVGGMGEVYLAEDTLLRRKAALKFLADDLRGDNDHLERFLREARAASSLNHPNICTIYEINNSDSAPFIAMEYIEGETVADMVRRRRRTVRQTLDIAIQVVEAMADAHANGIIHRDLKPANIIINPRGHVKILDFGLAKRLEAEGENSGQFLTQAGVILGTASYMSPEQARGLEVDPRTDIWSIGVCIYEMLTRMQPFTGETSSDTLAAVLTRDPKPPSHFYREIPAELDSIVMKAIRRPLDERYRSADVLASDLRSLRDRLTAGGQFSSAAETEREADDETLAFDSATTEFALPKLTDDAARPNNLSQSFHPIIGREREIDEIIEMLRGDDVRLVTLTGIGGTGKTSLAQTVARNALPHFANGVFFIELASVSRPELVVATIAQPLGVKDEGGKPIIEQLKEKIGDGEMLLVLDNFEQVVEAAPQIAELLESCSGLKILVTSRLLLRLRHENEFVVQPLTAPEEAPGVSFEEISDNPSVRLFTERAKSAKPSFRLTDENARDVAAICARLEGLPLAIELAAARIRILSPAEILAKLANRLTLLTGGPRDLPERQQTMSAAVEWSYDLLTDDEKALFRRLAVFAGGFRLAAAQFIATGREADSLSNKALNTVTSLVDHSLLLQKDLPNGESRFRILEVVRDFALAKLSEAGEDAPVRKEHTAYYVLLAEEAEPFIQAAQSAEWLDRLEEEHDNIRAAMAWALENDTPLAFRLAAAVRNFWILHSHLSEGYSWLKAALEADEEPPISLRFKLMNGLGLAARFRGDYETARHAYEKGYAAGIEAGDKKGTAIAGRGLGLVAMQQGDFEASRIYFESGLAISRELDDKFGIAITLSFLGDVCRTENEYAAAQPLYQESVELFREIDNKSALCDALNNLGAAYAAVGDTEKSEPAFREALETARTLGNKITISHSIDGFAALAASRGSDEHAVMLAGAAESVRESIGYKIEPAERAFRERYLDPVRSRFPKDKFDESTAVGKAMTIDAAIDEALDTAAQPGPPSNQTTAKPEPPAREVHSTVEPNNTPTAAQRALFTQELKSSPPNTISPVVLIIAVILLLAGISFLGYRFLF